MASPRSEAPMVEQIITEFFAKSLHIILGSRHQSASSRHSGDLSVASSSSSSSSSARPRDKWFNLALGDCPAALENMDLWNIGDHHSSPLVIDVILLRSEKIIERWVMQYESGGGGGADVAAAQRKVYKRLIIVLRSLHLLVRLLPAYKIFREGKVLPLELAHRVCSFVEPLSRVEEKEMEQFLFAPVETPCGRLCLSVAYLPRLEEEVGGEMGSPLAAEFISDYVGSPLAEPMKRFESPPSPVSLPASVSFTRRHSWSSCRRTTGRREPEIRVPVQRSISFDEKKSLPPSSAPGRISLNNLMRTESAPERLPFPLRHYLPPLPSQRSSKLLQLPPSSSKVLPGGLVGGASSLRLTYASGMSRISVGDEFVSSGFFCPFVEDEDFRADAAELRDDALPDRQHSSALSQGAAVGELVIMLKSAPPLHQDLPKLDAPVAAPPPLDYIDGRATTTTGGATCSSSIIRSRTTSDALEELRGYREMKDLLLRHGGGGAGRPNLLPLHPGSS
ncbi:autophagy-related protein 13 [Wolffia australiana]